MLPGPGEGRPVSLRVPYGVAWSHRPCVHVPAGPAGPLCRPIPPAFLPRTRSGAHGPASTAPLLLHRGHEHSAGATGGRGPGPAVSDTAWLSTGKGADHAVRPWEKGEKPLLWEPPRAGAGVGSAQPLRRNPTVRVLSPGGSGVSDGGHEKQRPEGNHRGVCRKGAQVQDRARAAEPGPAGAHATEPPTWAASSTLTLACASVRALTCANPELRRGHVHAHACTLTQGTSTATRAHTGTRPHPHLHVGTCTLTHTHTRWASASQG